MLRSIPDLLGHDVGKGHVKRRPLAFLALEADRAVHLLDEAFRQGETEPGARRFGPTLVETLEHSEHPIAGRLGDADAIVRDVETQLATVSHRAQRHVTPAGRELDRVRDEVE